MPFVYWKNPTSKEEIVDYQWVATVVMKNCDPLESGPAFAIDTSPVIKMKKWTKDFYWILFKVHIITS